jgi:hypothetical protein
MGSTIESNNLMPHNNTPAPIKPSNETPAEISWPIDPCKISRLASHGYDASPPNFAAAQRRALRRSHSQPASAETPASLSGPETSIDDIIALLKSTNDKCKCEQFINENNKLIAEYQAALKAKKPETPKDSDEDASEFPAMPCP